MTMSKTIIEFAKKFKTVLISLFIGGVAFAAGNAVVPDGNPILNPEVMEITENGPVPQLVATLEDETVIKIRTWGCENSDYRQDFEPTADNMVKHFPGEGIGAYQCPDGIGGQMFKITDPAKKITMTVNGVSEIENDVILENFNREHGLDGRAVAPNMNSAEEAQFRTQKIQEIQEAIGRARTFEDK